MSKNNRKNFAGDITVQLPRPIEGLYYYSPPENQFGTQITINLIKRIANNWVLSRPSRPCGVGDISYRNGGAMEGHGVGHRLGREVDIRPLRKDNTQQPVTWQDTANYDSENTEQLLRVIYIVATDKLRKIIFNDPILANKEVFPNVKYCETDPPDIHKHDNHIHVAFHP